MSVETMQVVDDTTIPIVIENSTRLMIDILRNGDIYDVYAKTYISVHILMSCIFYIDEDYYKGFFCLPDHFIKTTKEGVTIDGKISGIGYYDFATDIIFSPEDSQPDQQLRAINYLKGFQLDIKGKGKDLVDAFLNCTSSNPGFQPIQFIFSKKEETDLYKKDRSCIPEFTQITYQKKEPH